jgi:hypothetical protein
VFRNPLIETVFANRPFADVRRRSPGLSSKLSSTVVAVEQGGASPDREANEGLKNATGAQHCGFAFKITQHGLDMLSGA